MTNDYLNASFRIASMAQQHSYLRCAANAVTCINNLRLIRFFSLFSPIAPKPQYCWRTIMPTHIHNSVPKIRSQLVKLAKLWQLTVAWVCALLRLIRINRSWKLRREITFSWVKYRNLPWLELCDNLLPINSPKSRLIRKNAEKWKIDAWRCDFFEIYFLLLLSEIQWNGIKWNEWYKLI